MIVKTEDKTPKMEEEGKVQAEPERDTMLEAILRSFDATLMPSIMKPSMYRRNIAYPIDPEKAFNVRFNLTAEQEKKADRPYRGEHHKAFKAAKRRRKAMAMTPKLVDDYGQEEDENEDIGKIDFPRIPVPKSVSEWVQQKLLMQSLYGKHVIIPPFKEPEPERTTVGKIPDNDDEFIFITEYEEDVLTHDIVLVEGYGYNIDAFNVYFRQLLKTEPIWI